MAIAASLSSISLTPVYLGTSKSSCCIRHQDNKGLYKFVVRATTKGSTKSGKSEEKIPSWAKPDSDEPPPWAQESSTGTSSQSAFEIPFYAYLLASAITAIAAARTQFVQHHPPQEVIGSVFEYANQKPIFGVLNSDSILYAPILGFFAFTGVPTSAYLWYKSVQVANKEAEEQDRKDGFL